MADLPSWADAAELDAVAEQLARFERGAIDAERWRAFRVANGIYSQRQEGAYMLRVKAPQGVLTSAQLEVLGEVARLHSRGFGHLTSRQDVQFHFVPPTEIVPALRRLAAAGLTTRESGGNTVRNVTACAYAGATADEAFDVTPYAEATSRHLLRHPLAGSLPRKLKIAFEGCAHDHVLTAIQDVGFRAQLRERADGSAQRGFAVTLGGGTSTQPTAAKLFEAFLPAEDVLALAEAVVRFFHRAGDRQNNSRNRLKFLIRQLGWEPFRAELDAELQRVRAEGCAKLPFDAQRPPEPRRCSGIAVAPPPAAELAEWVASEGRRSSGPRPEPSLAASPADGERWRRTNVRRGRQPGHVLVTVAVPLGELTAAQFRALGALAASYAGGTVRVTERENLLLRDVPEGKIEDLRVRLAAAGLGLPRAGSLADVVTCPGAEVCRLGLTRARDLGRLLVDTLATTPALVDEAVGLDVRVSGCPNGCSRHHVAAIGLQGAARKLDGRSIPQYAVLVGGGASDGVTRFGRPAARIPARRVPDAIARLATLFIEGRREGEDAPTFFERTHPREVARALADLEEITPAAARPEDYLDVGDDHPFAPATQEGECAA